MLVGRDMEVHAALGLLTVGSVLAVGAPGAGTSVLLREVAARRGRRVFIGGALALAGLPYLGIERALRTTLPSDPARAADATVAIVGDGTLVVDDLSLAPPRVLELLEELAGRVALLCGTQTGRAGSRVRDRCSAAGFAIVELGALEPEETVAFLRARGDPRSDAQLTDLARAAGGDPALLDALARGGEDSPALRLLLAERVASLGPAAAESLLRLAVLARPAEPAIAGAGLAELTEAGAAGRTATGHVVLQAPVLGRHVLGAVSDAARRAMHAVLAGLVDDAAEAARHHEAAGHDRSAHRAAMAGAAGARTATEHARTLAVAARTAGPPHGELHLLAARALYDTMDLAGAAELAARVAAAGGTLRGRAELQLAMARRGLHDRTTAAAHVAHGLAAAGPEPWVRPWLLLERACLHAADGAPGAAQEARQAWSELAAAGEPDPAARLTLAEALVVSGSTGAIRHARSARLAADRSGHAGLACAARLLETRTLMAAGRPAQALALLRRSDGLTDRLGEGPATTLLRAWRAHLELHHRGDPARAVRLHEAIATGGAAAPPELRLDHALALADLGRMAEADVVARAVPLDHAARAVRAEVDWLGGRADRAARGAARALDLGAVGATAEALHLTLAWAGVDLGEPHRHRPGAGTPGGVRLQLQACALLATPGRELEAEERFREARGALSGEAARQELRCAWGQGEAARRAGARDRARAMLLEAEARAEEQGAVVLRARARRSLRQAGLGRRTRTRGPQTAPGTLSPRESEVLSLVAQGLSSSQAAMRLGVARSTVDTQVRSAMRKLGARTRIEAAVLAAD